MTTYKDFSDLSKILVGMTDDITEETKAITKATAKTLAKNCLLYTSPSPRD